jgi:hypothetical protein
MRAVGLGGMRGRAGTLNNHVVRSGTLSESSNIPSPSSSLLPLSDPDSSTPPAGFHARSAHLPLRGQVLQAI